MDRTDYDATTYVRAYNDLGKLRVTYTHILVLLGGT